MNICFGQHIYLNKSDCKGITGARSQLKLFDAGSVLHIQYTFYIVQKIHTTLTDTLFVDWNKTIHLVTEPWRECSKRKLQPKNGCNPSLFICHWRRKLTPETKKCVLCDRSRTLVIVMLEFSTYDSWSGAWSILSSLFLSAVVMMLIHSTREFIIMYDCVNSTLIYTTYLWNASII